METNEIVFITVISTLFLLVIVGFFIAFISQYQKRQRENQQEQDRLKEAFNQELLNTQLELKEQVFKQISQEIHDNIGQSLTVAKMQLNYISGDENKEKTTSAKELITRSLQDLRDLSKSLNGNFIMREGFEASIHREAAYIDKAGKLKCRVEGEYTDGLVDSNTEIILFRCVQECLSNAVKYSNGTEVVIAMENSSDSFQLEVKDDGQGMPDNWEQNRGVGIDSLEKRVGVLRGELKIDSKPNQGTRICINLNLQTKSVA